MKRKNYIILSTIAIALVLIGFITMLVNNKTVKTKQLQATIIESDNISDDPNGQPIILTTIKASNNLIYDYYTDNIKQLNSKCIITLNDKNLIIDVNYNK